MTKLFGPYKKSNRKASMQLSINAIVILVMAMAVLGLGLGLIRGVLTTGKDKLLGSLEGMDLSEQATSEKTIANVGAVKFKRNGENGIAISYYNVNSACSEGQLDIQCYKEGKVVETFFSEKDILPTKFKSGESTNVVGLFTLGEGIETGTHACKFSVVCTAGSQDVVGKSIDEVSQFVEVQS